MLYNRCTLHFAASDEEAQEFKVSFRQEQIVGDSIRRGGYPQEWQSQRRHIEVIRVHQAIFQQDIVIRMDRKGKRYFIEASRDFPLRELVGLWV